MCQMILLINSIRAANFYYKIYSSVIAKMSHRDWAIIFCSSTIYTKNIRDEQIVIVSKYQKLIKWITIRVDIPTNSWSKSYLFIIVCYFYYL